jgi:hypothetical protein
MRNRRPHRVLPNEVVQDGVEVKLDFLDGVWLQPRHDFEHNFDELIRVKALVVLE